MVKTCDKPQIIYSKHEKNFFTLRARFYNHHPQKHGIRNRTSSQYHIDTTFKCYYI